MKSILALVVLMVPLLVVLTVVLSLGWLVLAGLAGRLWVWSGSCGLRAGWGVRCRKDGNTFPQGHHSVGRGRADAPAPCYTATHRDPCGEPHARRRDEGERSTRPCLWASGPSLGVQPNCVHTDTTVDPHTQERTPS